jgi:RNA polymerase sigma-70 factor (ECF subfamily)
LREEGGGDDSILPRMMEANPRKATIRRELLEKVQAALSELPEIHQQVILLREIEGLSYEEMAEALEVPKGTIMSRLFHARKKMQAALEGYVDGDMDIEAFNWTTGEFERDIGYLTTIMLGERFGEWLRDGILG